MKKTVILIFRVSLYLGMILQSGCHRDDVFEGVWLCSEMKHKTYSLSDCFGDNMFAVHAETVALPMRHSECGSGNLVPEGEKMWSLKHERGASIFEVEANGSMLTGKFVVEFYCDEPSREIRMHLRSETVEFWLTKFFVPYDEQVAKVRRSGVLCHGCD